jgi:hypothetical protein
MKEKEKIMIQTITTQKEDAALISKTILAEEDAKEAAEEDAVDAVEEETTIVSI